MADVRAAYNDNGQAQTNGKEMADVRAAYNDNGQAHVLEGQATDAALRDLAGVNVAAAVSAFVSCNGQLRRPLEAGDVQPLEAEDVVRLADARPAELEAWRRVGLHAIRDGRIAAVLLAGGQGTRLRFNHPKGA